MSKLYIGIDNGTTGTIGFLTSEGYVNFVKTPTVEELSYTKKKQYLRRLDCEKFIEIITNVMAENNKNSSEVFCLLERPMVNPSMFHASISAVRIIEAQLVMLETLDIPHAYIDSKQWQKQLLPIGVKGSTELKKASKDIGIRLFPKFKAEITKHKDADGLLIAEFARMKEM